VNKIDYTSTASIPVTAEYSPQLIKKISAEYGTPTFICWEKIFRASCRRFKNEFSFPGREVVNSYSYKTNNLKTLCAIADSEGFGAEVVSPSELEMAEQLGVAGSRIFYNGPFKPETSLQKAVSIGAAIHIDSLVELSTLISIAEHLNKTARIAFRLTPEKGEKYGPVWNKFGLSVAEDEVRQALEVVAAVPGQVHLEGLHMHLGTNLTDPALYLNLARVMTEVAVMAKSQLEYPIQYIDIGGGFSAPSGSVPMIAHPDEWAPISLGEVVSGVTSILDQFDPEQRLTVVSEPGRILAESSMSLLTRVVSIKQRGPRLHIVLDGGTNILPSAYYTKHPICFPGKEGEGMKGKADIHGPLCTQFDVMASEVDVPKLAPGDFVLINGAGAYTYTFSSQFVGPRPPVVLVSSQTATLLVREKEPNDVLWQYDRLT